MSLESEITADFESLALEHGVECLWQGVAFTALQSRLSPDSALAIGGLVETPDLSLRALLGAFKDALPEVGDKIAVGGTAYRVSRASNHPRSPILLLTLTTADE